MFFSYHCIRSNHRCYIDWFYSKMEYICNSISFFIFSSKVWEFSYTLIYNATQIIFLTLWPENLNINSFWTEVHTIIQSNVYRGPYQICQRSSNIQYMLGTFSKPFIIQVSISSRLSKNISFLFGSQPFHKYKGPVNAIQLLSDGQLSVILNINKGPSQNHSVLIISQL